MLTNKLGITVGDMVTDGVVEGKVHRVFMSANENGEHNICLHVLCSQEKEDFRCTRIDWWRKADA